MERVSSIAIPRCILNGIEAEDVKAIQLHGFADTKKAALHKAGDHAVS